MPGGSASVISSTVITYLISFYHNILNNNFMPGKLLLNHEILHSTVRIKSTIMYNTLPFGLEP